MYIKVISSLITAVAVHKMIDLGKASGEREVTADKEKKTQIDVHVTDHQSNSGQY